MRISAFALCFAALFALCLAPVAYADCGKCAHDKPKDIVETAVAAGSFKTLATALTEADFVKTLKGKGPLTVYGRASMIAWSRSESKVPRAYPGSNSPSVLSANRSRS
jgi:hypothetical protein